MEMIMHMYLKTFRLVTVFLFFFFCGLQEEGKIWV